MNNYQGQKISKDIESKTYISSKNNYLKDNWRNVKLVETLILISKDFVAIKKQVTAIIETFELSRLY